MARQGRSYSTTQAQAIRKAQIQHIRSNSASTPHHVNGGNTTGASGAQQRAVVVNTVAVTDSDHEMVVIGSDGTQRTIQKMMTVRCLGGENLCGARRRGLNIMYNLN